MNLFNLTDDKEMALAGMLTGLGAGMSRASRGGANFLGALAEGGGAGMQNMMAYQNMASMQGMRALQQEELKRKIARGDALRSAFGVQPPQQPGAAPQPQGAPSANPAMITEQAPSPSQTATPGVQGTGYTPQGIVPPQNGPSAPQTTQSAGNLLGMLPPDLVPQIRSIAAADPDKALDIVTKYTEKMLDVGRWQPMESPNGGGLVLVDRYTGRMADVPLTFAQQLQKASAGATRNNISMRVDQAGSARLAELGATALSDGAKRMSDVNRTLGELDMMSEALKAYETGFAGEKGLLLKQGLEAAGVKTNAAAGEFFNSLATQMRLGSIPQGLGAVSNYEQEMYAKASPGLSLTRQGNELLIAAKREQMAREKLAYQIHIEEAQKNPQNLGVAYTNAAQRIMELGPTYSPQVMQALQNAANNNAAGAPQPTPAATPAAPGGNVIRYNSKGQRQ